jgi:hypothetical protein
VSQVWWCIPISPALRRLRQEDHELKVSLGYIARLKKKCVCVCVHIYI